MRNHTIDINPSVVRLFVIVAVIAAMTCLDTLFLAQAMGISNGPNETCKNDDDGGSGGGGGGGGDGQPPPCPVGGGRNNCDPGPNTGGSQCGSYISNKSLIFMHFGYDYQITSPAEQVSHCSACAGCASPEVGELPALNLMRTHKPRADEIRYGTSLGRGVGFSYDCSLRVYPADAQTPSIAEFYDTGAASEVLVMQDDWDGAIDGNYRPWNYQLKGMQLEDVNRQPTSASALTNAAVHSRNASSAPKRMPTPTCPTARSRNTANWTNRRSNC